jgi:hypothetical protein
MRKRRIIVTGIVFALVIVAAGGYSWYRQTHRPFLPPALSRSVDFTVYQPRQDTLAVNRDSISYDAATRVLTYRASLSAPRSQLTFTQQQTPGGEGDEAIDFPAMLRKVSASHDVPTDLGTAIVYHGESKTAGLASAISTQGTVIYIRSSQELQDTTWRLVYNKLVMAGVK